MNDVRRQLARAFREAGLDSPELDARLLVAHALRLEPRAPLPERNPTAQEMATIEALAARRLSREPVARIVGRKEFWSSTFEVVPATLVPRPETETLVETALALRDRGQGGRIADLGTGSGALLVALLGEYPQAEGIGTDVSVDALACARRNACASTVAARATFVACHYGSALAGDFDLVVSNPPYVARGEIASLAPEVRDFDPVAALDGGHDGLDAYRELAREAPRLLAPGGLFVVELGAGQAGAVTRLFADEGLTVVATKEDLAGIPRALALRRDP